MLIVVKIGSKLATRKESLSKLIEEISDLSRDGKRFIIISSGAIAYGKIKTGISPKTISEKQALSSIGQPDLMNFYSKEFEKYNKLVSQILITYHEINNRTSLFNLKNTVEKLLEIGVIPIFNENDAVGIDEIRFGNNDILGANLASLLEADLYIMLTDVDGVYKNYGKEGNELIRVVKNLSEIRRFSKGRGNEISVGGMKTKIEAANICFRSGIKSVIANGFKDGIIKKVLEGQEGTVFFPHTPKKEFENIKYKWFLLSKKKGSLFVDSGAVGAIKNNKSLLSAGITMVRGKFHRGDLVNVCDLEGNVIAVGITNYSSKEVDIIKGRKSSEIPFLLGISDYDEEVIHIDNMYVL